MKADQENWPKTRRIEPRTPGYPAAVSEQYGAKVPVLTCLGNLDLLEWPGIGFCGSRKASDKGLETARDCADQVARAGLVVVSGNAAGVDATAQKAALEAGGSTILVLPEGIRHFRIRKSFENVWSWERVLVISQYPDDAIWRANQAMKRNETIIALSRAMIVIEAGETGGTVNAGLSTLKSRKPLFVARYQDIEHQAPGNAKLLDLGGHPLSRSRQTGRASFQCVLDAAESQIPPSESGSQMAML